MYIFAKVTRQVSHTKQLQLLITNKPQLVATESEENFAGAKFYCPQALANGN